MKGTNHRMIIYETINLVNGKKYIGKDKRNDPTYLGSGILLGYAIKKYGIENFEKRVIEECSSYEELNERESYWIDHFNAVDSDEYYNLMPGGQGGDVPYCHTEEFRQKLSKALSGENNPNWGGKGFSKETREKISKINTGEGNPMYGKTHKKESKNKMKKQATNRYTLEWFQDRHGDDEGKRLYEERNKKLSEDREGTANPAYRDIDKKELLKCILEGMTIKGLSEHFGMATETVRRKIKEHFGMTITEMKNLKQYDGPNMSILKHYEEAMKKIDYGNPQTIRLAKEFEKRGITYETLHVDWAKEEE